ncbi:MAG: UDPGP type 1 family protein [Opitutales bacterium]|nr:UDPGP type 1 family protein [Opitutales bacterium]
MEKPSPSDIRRAFEEAGQGHVFAHFEKLGEKEQAHFIAQLREIDLAELDRLIAEHAGEAHDATDFSDLQPAPYVRHPANGGDPDQWNSARKAGEAALRAGRVAAFVVAGGQGTRLGYDGPKGTFPVTPVLQKPLFQVFAEKILAARRRYGAPVPWFIMTSHANHAATEAFFEESDYFGLGAGSVHFFTQGRMPAVDFSGKIILEDKGRIAMSPDGHGGSLRALVRRGAVDTMRAAGVDILSYFQVDNPLVRVIDPAFIGFHVQSGSEMSSKMIPKAYPEEKVGHFCKRGDRLLVVEYSDLPAEMQAERTADGELRFLAGSIAIHILSVDFVHRVGSGSVDTRLPFHRAEKKIPTIDAAGHAVRPEKPNGIKFEMFVFDALPLAKNPIIIETLRSDDFSPVKNAEGLDSPATCRDDQLRQFARWAQTAGIDLTTDESGLPAFAFEVSPLFAEDAETFAANWKRPASPQTLTAGTCLGEADLPE